MLILSNKLKKDNEKGARQNTSDPLERRYEKESISGVNNHHRILNRKDCRTDHHKDCNLDCELGTFQFLG